jgi:hypothetical protein
VASEGVGARRKHTTVREERIHMLHRDFNMVMIEKYEWLVSDE